ncbi:MAG: DUF177 domain-containing protein [Muribaculaceae bacterium]|nr:DUF177 domain-containing protein [Muribaculaceae bacterium]
MASFKWNLKALPFGNQSVIYHLDGSFFRENEPTRIFAANVDVDFSISRKSEQDYELAMDCHGTLNIECDRCLEEMVHVVDVRYELSVRQEGSDYDDSNEHVLVVPSSWRELDVEPLVRDTVLLTIPIMHHHDDGECNSEMMDALGRHSVTHASENEEDNNDGEAAIDPRWEALQKLKKNN